VCLLLLCAAYLQGGINKLPTSTPRSARCSISACRRRRPGGAGDRAGTGRLAGHPHRLFRWLGAGFLGVFTLMATFVANRFWEMGGHERFMAANSFFEHLG
jgi:hypothetical protein